MQTGERRYKTLCNCLLLVWLVWKRTVFYRHCLKLIQFNFSSCWILIYSFGDYYFPAVYCCADSLNVFAFITESNWHIDFSLHGGWWYFFQSDCTFPFETLAVFFFLNWVSLLPSRADALHKYWCLTARIILFHTRCLGIFLFLSISRLCLVMLKLATCSLRISFFYPCSYKEKKKSVFYSTWFH